MIFFILFLLSITQESMADIRWEIEDSIIVKYRCCLVMKNTDSNKRIVIGVNCFNFLKNYYKDNLRRLVVYSGPITVNIFKDKVLRKCTFLALSEKYLENYTLKERYFYKIALYLLK